MGIKNLGTIISKQLKKRHISEIQNSKVAVDGLNWIYKGIYCDFDSEKKMIDKVLNFFNKMLMVLKLNNIEPIIVLDGKYLKVKEKIHIKRRKLRDSFKEKAEINLHNKDYDSYYKNLNWAKTIDADLINEFILYLKKSKINFIISPYESDSQIVYLMNEAMIDYIISEDYDLILYGGNKIIYRLNTYGTFSYFDMYEQKEKLNDHKFIIDKNNKNFINFLNLNGDMLNFGLIIAGCDYLDNIPGIGIKKSLKIVLDNNSYEEVIEYLEANKHKYKIPENYYENLKNTFYCYTKQVVYNFEEKELVYFDNSTQKSIDNLGLENITDYIGEIFENAEEFINGNLDNLNLEARKFPEFSKSINYHLSKIDCPNLKNYISERLKQGKDNLNINIKDEYLKSTILNSNNSNSNNKNLTENEKNEIENFCLIFNPKPKKQIKEKNNIETILNNDNKVKNYEELNDLFKLDKKKEKITNKIKKKKEVKVSSKITKLKDLDFN